MIGVPLPGPGDIEFLFAEEYPGGPVIGYVAKYERRGRAFWASVPLQDSGHTETNNHRMQHANKHCAWAVYRQVLEFNAAVNPLFNEPWSPQA